MKFLAFALALFLLFSVASADIISDTRAKIRAEFENRPKFGLFTRPLKERFTLLTVTRFFEATPNYNVIVVHGKHQFTVTDGPHERYDEVVEINKRNFSYTVILFHGGKIEMQGAGGYENLRIWGKCEKHPKRVWTCQRK
ncbi:hypothetical protein BD779DRAFT_931837 [Infundibulicybe gibba]|nr:hypothetical protein BD779DRAFT_931837 [Infundibulicybe gibba]